MTVQPDMLRAAMRQWATGVTVVCTQHNGVRHGMTVSSFMSVSLDPPLIIISLEQSTRTCDLVRQAGCFAVTILARDQQGVSIRFAGGEAEGTDRFAGLKTETLVTGAPLISGGLSFLDCEVESSYMFGSQWLFVGRVVALQTWPSSEPLLYFNRNYHQLNAQKA